eukprot:1158918-Pelagomonas_calceolata.AAC.4
MKPLPASIKEKRVPRAETLRLLFTMLVSITSSVMQRQHLSALYPSPCALSNPSDVMFFLVHVNALTQHVVSQAPSSKKATSCPAWDVTR